MSSSVNCTSQITSMKALRAENVWSNPQFSSGTVPYISLYDFQILLNKHPFTHNQSLLVLNLRSQYGHNTSCSVKLEILTHSITGNGPS